MSSAYLAHLAHADVTSLFQEINSIRANTENYVARPGHVQPVRPDQILRNQHDYGPSNPTDVLQYHLSSVSNGEAQLGGGNYGGLTTSHHVGSNYTRSPVYPQPCPRRNQYTSPGQLPSWHNGPPLEAFGHGSFPFSDNGVEMPGDLMQAETTVSGTSLKSNNMRPSAESPYLNIPSVAVESLGQELNLDHGWLSLDDFVGTSSSIPQDLIPFLSKANHSLH